MKKTKEISSQIYYIFRKDVRPKENQFVRIKSGLYGGDIGIVYSVKTDDAIWIKLVPRVDPSPKSKKDNKR